MRLRDNAIMSISGASSGGPRSVVAVNSAILTEGEARHLSIANPQLVHRVAHNNPRRVNSLTSGTSKSLVT